MKVVFYSTNTTTYQPSGACYAYPLQAENIERAVKPHLEGNEFVLVTTPHMRLLCDQRGNDVAAKAEHVKYVFLENDADAAKVAEVVAAEEPDLAVAIGTPTFPFDWNYLDDSVVAEMLRAKGIEVRAQPTFASIALFDKWRSQKVFKAEHCKTAEGIFVNAGLYLADEGNPVVSGNAYRDYVNYRIENLSYPIILKSTTGASSAGLTVAKTPAEAMEYTAKVKSEDDFMAEELISGEQFGTEIHKTPDGYAVLPPFRFSTGEAGITDPLLSMKFGPVADEAHNVEELQTELATLAKDLHLQGIAQVDLVFHDGDWYIVEINPRISGMSALSTAAEGRSAFQVYVDSIFGPSADFSKMENLKYVFTFKCLGATIDDLKEFAEKEDSVANVLCLEMHYGEGLSTAIYSEVILGGFETKEALLAELDRLHGAYPNIVGDQTIEGAKKIVR